MRVEYNANRNIRTISDDLNQITYLKEIKCAECREWISEDSVVWINENEINGPLAYCESCCPEQDNY